MDSGSDSVHRDGRSGPPACALLPPTRYPSRSLGVVRAFSLWFVLRIHKLFLKLTETLCFYVLSGRDLFVTLGSFEFWWPALVSASVGLFHCAQDPELRVLRFDLSPLSLTVLCLSFSAFSVVPMFPRSYLVLLLRVLFFSSVASNHDICCGILVL